MNSAAANTGVGYANLSYSGNIGPTATYWASQTGNGSSGIPAISVSTTTNTTTSVANAGSGGAHNNLSPYIALNFIIKV